MKNAYEIVSREYFLDDRQSVKMLHFIRVKCAFSREDKRRTRHSHEWNDHQKLNHSIYWINRNFTQNNCHDMRNIVPHRGTHWRFLMLKILTEIFWHFGKEPTVPSNKYKSIKKISTGFYWRSLLLFFFFKSSSFSFRFYN